MKKKFVSMLVCIGMLSTLLMGCSTSTTKTASTKETEDSKNKSADPEDYQVVMIVKQSDSWFDDMATGVEQLKKDTGLNVTVQVPETGDAASQISIMEDLIAQGVDAICIVPNDPSALIPTIEKAKEAGIVVVSHEAPGIADTVDLDVEAFVNKTFGELFGEKLAKAMGGKGKYAGFVGGLTMETHMEWYQSAVDYITENYPEMECVTKEPYEDGNSVEGAHDKTLEILKTYPDIAGFFDCSAHGGGICEALQEKNKAKEVKVVSLALPSMSATYLEDGSMQAGLAWRPADAGYATCYAAYLLASGQEIKTGTDLKITGYDAIEVKDGVAYGNAPLEFTAENINDYKF
ncbi:substrate-binding domain-containing protein [Clostridiaceae bacterium 68-1-5]|uniref:Substrate-binding domain-containing protein n=1 Tax=Suipraeoptans intestinalis TaxID=2606628 RepID=A0A6N7V0U6_9FIRM|nr:autoinducer 2 ABC transporter substrate-binding protein [Suipraeoptans intestinalis]MSR93486.1 substrate-binding domain-containing protein [Suipraeoptans intestinalis]